MRISSLSIVASVVLLMSAFFSSVTQALVTYSAMPRIGTATVSGKQKFVLKSTGALFVPRGANYTRLAGTAGYHLVFDPGAYNSTNVETALKGMKSAGYNYVRVFLSSAYMEGGFGMTTPGFNQTWLDNVADFMSRAAANGLRVHLTSSWVPTNFMQSLAYNPTVAGVNVYLFDTGGVQAQVNFWKMLLTALKAKSPNILTTLFAIDIANEAWVDLSKPPLSYTSGSFTMYGVKYDLSVASQRQQLIDASGVAWMNALRTAIKSIDSQILVGTSVYSPILVGHNGFDGAKIPTSGSEFRYPLRSMSLMTYSTADYLDFHSYPKPNLTLGDELNAAEFTIGKSLTKPLIMGEFGAQKSDFPTAASAALFVRENIINSCKYGFSGSALWTYNTTEQQDFWHGTEGSSAINKAVGPTYLADVCTSTLNSVAPVITAGGIGCTGNTCAWLSGTNVHHDAVVDLRRVSDGTLLRSGIKPTRYVQADTANTLYGKLILVVTVPSGLMTEFQQSGLNFYVVNPTASTFSAAPAYLKKP